MTYSEVTEASCATPESCIAVRIQPKAADLGDFSVRRSLPSPECRQVGPFVFFDHMGPADFPPGKSISVRPHPHIGIATITYLFGGEIMHRDSLGFEQRIKPGTVNLMVAGNGIVHSERAGADLDQTSRLHGIQSWIALPEDQEEIVPAFHHYPCKTLREISLEGATIRIIMGDAYGSESLVQQFSKTLYLDVLLDQGATLQTPQGYEELAVYVVSGEVMIGKQTLPEGVMGVLRHGDTPSVTATESTRLKITGGEPLSRRYMFWNFVSSRPERIEAAKSDWRKMKFATVKGDEEFIPLPEDK